MIYQKTISSIIATTGIGLHSGEQVHLRVLPAPINSGIVFRRVDLNPPIEIPAFYKHVFDTTLCTCLKFNSAHIATVEHLLSALAGLNIDNATIEVDAAEIPIMDGSSRPFVELLQSAGICEQDAPKVFIKILKTLRVEDTDKYVELKPYDGYKISFTIDFKHPVFVDKLQTATFDFASDSYVDSISDARTFGFLSDYEYLRTRELAKGGSLENAIVVDDTQILNKEGLRHDGEFVFHKILDVIGDFNLLNAGIIGSFEGYKSGHHLNNLLLRKLMEQTDAWEYSHHC